MDDWAKDHLLILGAAIIAFLVLIYCLYTIFKKCCQNPKTERSEPTVKFIYSNQLKPEAHKCPICCEIPLRPKILLKCSNGHSLCNQCLTSFQITNCPKCLEDLNEMDPEKVLEDFWKTYWQNAHRML